MTSHSPSSGHLARISSLNGGIAVAVHGLTHALVDSGHRVRIATPADSGLAVGDWSHASAESYSTVTRFEYGRRLRSLVAGWDSSVIHVHGLWMYHQLAALLDGRRSGRPYVVSPHGMLDSWALSQSSVRKSLMRRVFVDRSLRRAACIHALCVSELESIRALGFGGPIALIPNGVDLPPRHEVLEVKREDTVLFLGRLHPKKGLMELLTAWGRGIKGWRLKIAGWGDPAFEEALRSKAAREGSGTVEFLGPVMGAEKEELLRKSGAFVLPSHSEGLPMAVLEAWAFGVPVLMSKACNLPEGFLAGAALEAEANPDSIVVALHDLADSTLSERKNLVGRGRDLVERQFSWSSVASRMNSVYSWTLGGELPSHVDVKT